MEYMTPNFTRDMVKTHTILIPNMAVTQFRLIQAALASEGYKTEVLGNCVLYPTNYDELRRVLELGMPL